MKKWLDSPDNMEDSILVRDKDQRARSERPGRGPLSAHVELRYCNLVEWPVAHWR